MTRRRSRIANIENLYRGLRALPALRHRTQRIVPGSIPSAEAWGRATVQWAGVSHGHSSTSGDLFVKHGTATMQRTASGTVTVGQSAGHDAYWLGRVLNKRGGPFVVGFGSCFGVAVTFGGEWVGVGAGVLGGIANVVWKELFP